MVTSDDTSRNSIHSSLNLGSLDLGGTDNYLSIDESIRAANCSIMKYFFLLPYSFAVYFHYYDCPFWANVRM
ncbi:hypothetical protein M0R45_029365 [Rubus argutus]|uniref:Uncharacterized protein n=1 Tax=Rubus argutus TaxID=59490 RepID=A0AAW1WBV7_RUBAR